MHSTGIFRPYKTMSLQNSIILPGVQRHNEHTMQQFFQQCMAANSMALCCIGIDAQQCPTLVHIPGANPAEIAQLLETVARELRAQTTPHQLIKA